jgi:hypothetical protein
VRAVGAGRPDWADRNSCSAVGRWRTASVHRHRLGIDGSPTGCDSIFPLLLLRTIAASGFRSEFGRLGPRGPSSADSSFVVTSLREGVTLLVLREQDWADRIRANTYPIETVTRRTLRWRLPRSSTSVSVTV